MRGTALRNAPTQAALTLALLLLPAVVTLAVRSVPLAFLPPRPTLFAFELITSIVALLVAYVGLRSYLERGSVRLLTLGLGFCVYGIFDLLFGVTASPRDHAQANLAIWFWLVGRALGSTLVTASVLLPETSRVAESRHGSRELALWLGALLLAAVVLMACGWLLRDVLPPLISAERGLAPGVVAVEWLGVLAETFVALAYLRRYAQSGLTVLRTFALGMASLAAGDFAFSVYNALFDPIFWLGYGYKLFAYACLAAGTYSLVRPRSTHRSD